MQFLRRYANEPPLPAASAVLGAPSSSEGEVAVRDETNPSGLMIGTTTTRTCRSSSVIGWSLPKFLARWMPISRMSSAAGHSRAWWTPIRNATGFWSSVRLTSEEISTPTCSRPWNVFCGSVTGLTIAG